MERRIVGALHVAPRMVGVTRIRLVMVVTLSILGMAGAAYWWWQSRRHAEEQLARAQQSQQERARQAGESRRRIAEARDRLDATHKQLQMRKLLKGLQMRRGRVVAERQRLQELLAALGDSIAASDDSQRGGSAAEREETIDELTAAASVERQYDALLSTPDFHSVAIMLRAEPERDEKDSHANAEAPDIERVASALDALLRRMEAVAASSRAALDAAVSAWAMEAAATGAVARAVTYPGGLDSAHQALVDARSLLEAGEFERATAAYNRAANNLQSPPASLTGSGVRDPAVATH